MAYDGVTVRVGDETAVLYQHPLESGIAEPALLVRRYGLDGIVSIIQGDAEVIVGGAASLRQLTKVLNRMANELK